MKIYKDYMDGIKAPEELIQRTKEKMRDPAVREVSENRNTRSSETVSHRRLYLTGAALAACFALFFTAATLLPKTVTAPAEDVSVPAPDSFSGLVWQPVAEEVTRAAEELTDPAGASADEAGQEDGDPLPAAFETTALFPSYELVRRTATDTSCVFFLRNENSVIRYQVSSAAASVPEPFRDLPAQEYEGTPLRLGISGDRRTRFILREADGLWLFITAKDVPEGTLREILKNFSVQV